MLTNYFFNNQHTHTPLNRRKYQTQITATENTQQFSHQITSHYILTRHKNQTNK